MRPITVHISIPSWFTVGVSTTYDCWSKRMWVYTEPFWSTQGTLLTIASQEVRKTTRNFNQDFWCPGGDSK
jgi:hypothetical protein